MANLPVRFDVFDRKISNFILMVNKMANFKLDSEVKKKNKKKNSMITRHDCGKTKKFWALEWNRKHDLPDTGRTLQPLN